MGTCVQLLLKVAINPNISKAQLSFLQHYRNASGLLNCKFYATNDIHIGPNIFGDFLQEGKQSDILTFTTLRKCPYKKTEETVKQIFDKTCGCYCFNNKYQQHISLLLNHYNSVNNRLFIFSHILKFLLHIDFRYYKFVITFCLMASFLTLLSRMVTLCDTWSNHLPTIHLYQHFRKEFKIFQE